MYRFSVDGEDWILRFSPHIILDEDNKQFIIQSLLHLEKKVTNIKHGEAFMILNDQMGATIFDVERIPSFILTVSNIIPKESWYNLEFHQE